MSQRKKKKKKGGWGWGVYALISLFLSYLVFGLLRVGRKDILEVFLLKACVALFSSSSFFVVNTKIMNVNKDRQSL